MRVYTYSTCDENALAFLCDTTFYLYCRSSVFFVFIKIIFDFIFTSFLLSFSPFVIARYIHFFCPVK